MGNSPERLRVDVGIRIARTKGMALPAPVPALTRPDALALALCAAELNEPFDLVHTPASALAELFGAVGQLRAIVPFATVRLLARLSSDERDEIRVGVARGLAAFVDVYPDRVEELLLPLACDPARRVRAAAADTLAKLLAAVPDVEAVIERWRWHPDRAVEVLEKARKAAKRN